jgi:hypothetical protein
MSDRAWTYECLVACCLARQGFSLVAFYLTLWWLYKPPFYWVRLVSVLMTALTQLGSQLKFNTYATQPNIVRRNQFFVRCFRVTNFNSWKQWFIIANIDVRSWAKDWDRPTYLYIYIYIYIYSYFNNIVFMLIFSLNFLLEVQRGFSNGIYPIQSTCPSNLAY